MMVQQNLSQEPERQAKLIQMQKHLDSVVAGLPHTFGEFGNFK